MTKPSRFSALALFGLALLTVTQRVPDGASTLLLVAFALGALAIWRLGCDEAAAVARRVQPVPARIRLDRDPRV